MPIRVVIVDDHDMIRSGIAVFIQSCKDLELVGEAANASDAIRLCEVLRPDIVLMDLVMPGMDGVTGIRTLRESLPETQIIALTTFDDEQLVQSALQAGAISYLLKNVSAHTLADAIRDAAQGKSSLSPEVTQVLVQLTHRVTIDDYILTKREREVLQLMVRGYTNLQIAGQLTVSHSTAKKHVGNVIKKLETNSRTEAVAVALQRKLVTS